MSQPPRLQLYAGATAFTRIQREGLQANDVKMLIGASGGPKWFCLFGLDQYLLSTFFKNRLTPLELLGSSAGAWRFACFAQTDGAAASRRFCDAYRTLCYPANAPTSEVTAISKTVLDAVFPNAAHVAQVVSNEVFRLNFIVAQKKGRPLVGSRIGQLGQISSAAAVNLLHRPWLGRLYQRILFAQKYSRLEAPDDLPTTRHELTAANLQAALLASGSIPLVLDPVTEIAGMPRAQYIDGGLVDYHFAWPFQTDGLVLFPHFYPHASPGWFDKSLPWRRAKPKLFSQVAMLCPTPQWVASLPYGKIPDRTDFNKLPDTARIAYWQEVTERSFELAEDFANGQFQLLPFK
ncbi:MAG: patatin-like phospholipase family protein [Rheinheimera sp.]|nr:patatin-like phospholipase family protein [Rheinheimera sp.]